MNLLWLPVGLILPTLSGWFLLRLLEGRHLVLLRTERLALGLLFGLTGTMFVTFLAHLAGLVLFTRWGFISVQVALTVLLTIARLLQWKLSPRPTPYALPPTPSHRSPLWIKLALALVLLWTIAKIAFGSFILVTTPPIFDDTLKNWNFRARVFYETHTLDVGAPADAETNTLSAYPPFVSLAKTELASFAGVWDEGLVNSIQVVWFLALLTLLFSALRRHLPSPWALLGVILLASLPLELFQGVNAYADVFLSCHLLATVVLVVHGFLETDRARRSAFMRLAALAIALLTITKNEALLLYLPLLLALLAGGLVFSVRAGRMSRREAFTALLWCALFALAITFPWILFKWVHGLAFGNAKSVSTDYAIGWQPGVLRTLWINTFFEGNWNLLFPLFLLLLIFRWREAFRGSLAPFTFFVLATLSLQISLFLFTSLSVEALKQTGFGRGIIQIVPLIVLVTTVLLKEGMRRE